MDRPLEMTLKVEERPAPDAGAARAAPRQDVPMRGALFRKYLVLFIGLVSAALLLNAAVDLGFTYRDNRALLARLQLEKAEAARQRIEQFIGDIQRQLDWTTTAQWAAQSIDQRHFDYVLLLRQVPAITELSQLDADGREQLKVSRLAIDLLGSQADLSHDPVFTETRSQKVWFSPVHFRMASEPYLTLAIAGAGRRPGVTVAEVNLKLIWDVVTSMKIGQTGYAYVVDRQGRLIAHPDISLVLRDTSFASLPQVAEGLRELEAPQEAAAPAIDANFAGQEVLSAHAALAALGWLVFVELPMTEALAPLFESALHTVLVLAASLILAALAAWFMVRRIVGPIRMLQAGAARIGAGDLDASIEVDTGDELESLAGQFNTMAGQLKQSYAGLERKVEERTRDLARSVSELQALSEVGHAVNSTLDLNAVLRTIVARAIVLAEADAGAVFRFNEAEGTFEIAESSGMDAAFVAKLRSLHIAIRESAMGEAAVTQRPIQLTDLALGPSYPLRTANLAAGFHAALVVPLIGPERTLGALVLVRRAVGDFAPAVVELMTAFANQSALAMQNAHLFQELADKGRQLELASAHKSQFLANMSHELRTPLNAILGYTELLVDGIYGELQEKPRGVLERVQENGRNLLALINDVLDLAKIEAGQLTLAIDDYSAGELARGVVGAMEPLARAKGLSLVSRVDGTVPPGRGDAQRLRQVLINLVGNAIKFTDAGGVEVSTSAADGRFRIAVRDSGPGIAPEEQEAIFEEFHQIDNTSTRKKGGTGLGLAIARQIVELHGGHLTLVSALGQGATFVVDIPVCVETAAETAR